MTAAYFLEPLHFSPTSPPPPLAYNEYKEHESFTGSPAALCKDSGNPMASTERPKCGKFQLAHKVIGHKELGRNKAILLRMTEEDRNRSAAERTAKLNVEQGNVPPSPFPPS